MNREEKKREAQRLRQEGKRLKEIAAFLGISVATASVYCRGVFPRGTPAPDPRKAKSLEVIQELYPRGIPVTEIAERIGVPVATLYDWLREAPISRNSRRVYVTDDLRERIRQKTSTDPDGVFREEAARLYIDEQWATTEIGEKLGVSAVTIGQWLEQLGIERRQQPTARVREKLRLANLGPKRYNWKGGITPDQIRIRMSLPMRLAREACFERDDYVCQSCGERGGKLNAHHVWPFQRFPHLQFEMSNLITLCRECHDQFHNAAGGHVRVAIGPFFYPKKTKVKEARSHYEVCGWEGRAGHVMSPFTGGGLRRLCDQRGICDDH